MKEGAERITKRILEDAHAAAEKIREESAEKAASAESEARQKAERRQETILEQGRKDAEEQKRRIIGVAELEARKELLSAKQEMIGEAFQKSLEQLTGQDDRDYLSVIREMLLNFVETGTETVIFSERDLKRISDDFWKEINNEVSGKDKQGDLKLSEETRNIKGGFILQSDGVEVNCSFEALLEMKRDELEPELAAILFK